MCIWCSCSTLLDSEQCSHILYCTLVPLYRFSSRLTESLAQLNFPINTNYICSFNPELSLLLFLLSVLTELSIIMLLSLLWLNIFNNVSQITNHFSGRKYMFSIYRKAKRFYGCFYQEHLSFMVHHPSICPEVSFSHNWVWSSDHRLIPWRALLDVIFSLQYLTSYHLIPFVYVSE